MEIEVEKRIETEFGVRTAKQQIETIGVERFNEPAQQQPRGLVGALVTSAGRIPGGAGLDGNSRRVSRLDAGRVTGRFDGGWTVEMAIPFKSLRYKPGRDQVWGINLRRGIREELRAMLVAYLRPWLGD